MTGAAIRVATSGDTGSLVRLRGAWVEERWGPTVDPTFTDRFEQWVDAERHHRVFWLAEVEGIAVGMVNLVTFTRMPVPGQPAGAWGYLGNMYVVEAHRQAGIGRLLLDALVTHADVEGLERIVLNPTERSMSFYRRAGFDVANELLLRPRR